MGRCLALLVLTLVAACADTPAPLGYDGQPCSQEVLHLDAAGVIRVEGHAPVDLAAPGHEATLRELLTPIAEPMAKMHMSESSESSPLLVGDWLRIRVDRDTPFAHLDHLLESANGHRGLHYFKFALQFGPDPAVRHHVFGDRLVAGSICLTDGPIYGYSLDLDDRGEPRFGFASRSQYGPTEDDSEPYVALFSSGDPRAVRARFCEQPEDEHLGRALEFPELLVARDMLAQDVERAITELLPAKGWLRLGKLEPENPWDERVRIRTHTRGDVP